MLRYIKTLKFEEEPKYQYLRELFQKIIDREYKDGIALDWLSEIVEDEDIPDERANLERIPCFKSIAPNTQFGKIQTPRIETSNLVLDENVNWTKDYRKSN